MLTLAIDNLRSFRAVGLTEQFVASLALFSTKLQWPRTPVALRENIGTRPGNTLSRVEMDEIAKREKHDMTLYDVAKDLLARDLAEAGPELTKVTRRITHPGAMHRMLLFVLQKTYGV